MSETLNDHKPVERMRSAHWSDHREKITFLYQTQGRELKDVQRIMKDQYNFDASESMYKKKIRQWHLQRNLRAEEKEYIISQLAERERNGKPEHLILWRGQPVDMAIITRHRRDMARKSITQLSAEPKRTTTNQADIRVLTPPPASSGYVDGVALARSMSHSSWTSDMRSTSSTEAESPRESPPRARRPSRPVASTIPTTLDSQANMLLLSSPMDYHDLITVLDYCSIADRLVSMGHFSAGRMIVKVAGNLLFKMSLLSESKTQSSAIDHLPISLGTLFLYQRVSQTGLTATDSFFRHALPLMQQYFDPTSPVVRLLEGFYELEDRSAAYAHIVHFVLRNSNSGKEPGSGLASGRSWSQSKQRSASPPKSSNPGVTICDTREEHLNVALTASEELLGSFHRQTLSHLSNQAWLNLAQFCQSGLLGDAKRASEFFATLFARVQTTTMMSEVDPSVSEGQDETVFVAETFRGAILASVASGDLDFVRQMAEEGIRFIGKQCDSVDPEYRNNILEFLLSHSNST